MSAPVGQEPKLQQQRLEFARAKRILAEEHRRLQQTHGKLEAAQAQLIQSEKMATVGQLAAGVAHEINNPVAFIKSNLGTLRDYCVFFERVIGAYQLLADGVRSGDDARVPALLESVDLLAAQCDLDYLIADAAKIVDESSAGAQRVAEIVTNLRSFSRPDQEDLQEADINECLESTLKIAWNQLKYKCQVVKEFSELPSLECRPGELNQVFLNLLVNASHAVEEKGTVTVKTFERDDHIVVEIADDGCGMTEAVRERIFEPFFTTKPVGDGTGLGLAISYSIIEKHGGSINVESEPGSGTAFSIHLPIQNSEACEHE